MGSFVRFVNRVFSALGSWLQSPILLVLRVFFGIGFFIAGFSKLQDIHKFQDYLTSLSIPNPEIGAWATALTETIGGAFLVVGLLSRFVSLPLIVVMVTAYSTAHFESIQTALSNPQVIIDQPPFLFLLTALLVFAFGPGYFSIDALCGCCSKSCKKEEAPTKTS